MRELVLVLVVLAVWCEAAFAKPKVAILGLEVVVSGAKANPKDLQIAASLTDSLRQLPRSGAGKLELAPNSDRELIDEKLAGSCLTENLYCMAPIGLGLGADYLVYGNLVKATEAGQDGYQVSLKLLDAKSKPPKLGKIVETFVPVSTIAGSPDGPQAWTQQIYAKLTDDVAEQARLAVNANVKRGDVHVDGAKQGRLTGGTLTLALPEGPHEVVIESPGYQRYQTTVTVTSGQMTTANAKLKPNLIDSSLTLGKGKFLIAGSTINLDISDRQKHLMIDRFGDSDVVSYDDPLLLSFAPSVWYGLNDNLTIGITHDFGTLPWTPRPTFLTSFVTTDIQHRDSALGAGLCVTALEGDESFTYSANGVLEVSRRGCPASHTSSIYNSAGADILYSLKQGRLSLAAHPGIDMSVRYPFKLDMRLGALGHITVNDRLSLVFEPRLRFDLIDGCRGDSCDESNHNMVELPVWSWVHINHMFSIYLHTAFNNINGDLEGIPLQLGGNCRISQRLMFGLDFGFRDIYKNSNKAPSITNPDIINRFESRALGLRVIYTP